MKYTTMGLVLAAAAIALTASASSAPFERTKPEAQAATTQVVCQGNRRNYRNFNHCMRFIGNGARYCARICSG